MACIAGGDPVFITLFCSERTPDFQQDPGHLDQRLHFPASLAAGHTPLSSGYWVSCAIDKFVSLKEKGLPFLHSPR